MRIGFLFYIVVCLISVGSLSAKATDLSVLSVCTHWPKLKCAGGDLYVHANYWHLDEANKDEVKGVREKLEKKFKKLISKWNRKTGINYEVFWNVGLPNDEETSGVYKVYLQFRDLVPFVNKAGMIVSTVLNGVDNGEVRATGPMLIRKDNKYWDSIERYIECNVIDEFYAEAFREYLIKNSLNKFEYCELYFTENIE